MYFVKCFFSISWYSPLIFLLYLINVMIILIDYEMLNQSCIPGITPARAYHIIILYTIWFHFFKWKDLKASPQRINIVSMWQDVPYHVTEEIKMKMRYHYTSIRMAMIKKTGKTKYWWGCQEDGILIYFLTQDTFILLQFWRPEVWNQGAGRPTLPLEALPEILLFHLPVAVGFPWLPTASLSAPPSRHLSSTCLPLKSLSLSYKDTCYDT